MKNRICVICEEICEFAPTKRGWSEIIYKNGNRHGVHWDCMRRILKIAEKIEKKENE